MTATMIIRRFSLVSLLVFLSLPVLAGQKKASPELKTGSLNITIVRNENGKPVKNAEVVLHLLDNHGKERQEGLELKTHDDGKAAADSIPYGKVRIQVIARGLRTYGDDYTVGQPNMEITIKMLKPSEQISIYK
jgi:5-hydroxyisourate hydrolase-like protein (transthyretin family)